MFKYAGVNPCAEEPLPAGGSCLLGAINLSEFVDNPFTKDAAFNIPEVTLNKQMENLSNEEYKLVYESLK